MESRKKSTYRKIEHHRIESVYLIIRGVEVGIFAGLIAVLYRFLLAGAEKGLMSLLASIRGSGLYTALWFAALAALGVFIAFVNRLVPDASGSGIPVVSGELKGYVSPNWWKVILAKLVGGTVSVFSGLSLGREGPSVQLGGMAGKGIARLTKADITTERRMLSSGAGAGMAAAFNSPLAGTMFVLEELHHTFDKSLLCMSIVACIVADYTSKLFFGQDTIFNYDSVNFPLRYYWILVLIGALLGLCGAAYNVIMSKAQDLYKKIKFIPDYIKMPCVFLISGGVGLVLPQVLCGGHSMSELLIRERPEISFMLLLLAAKFLFGAICFASGAPGGTLYPLCVIGAYLGAVLGTGSISLFGISPSLWEEFVVIGMAGFFASIVRAPITAVVLVFELTGNMKNLLPVAVVALISYATANLLGVKPFYEHLTEKLIFAGRAKPEFSSNEEKVLRTITVSVGSPVERKRIMDIDWGKHCIVVSLERDGVSVTPKGDTKIKEGDELVILVSQRRFAQDYERLDRLIKGESYEN
jgi:H+/Cl- antiporter ClcA